MNVKNLPYNILALSDSPLTCTGYATVTKDLMNILNTKPYFNVNVLGHNYLGQNLVPPIKFEDKSEINFKLWGGGQKRYAEDLIEPRIQETKADIFWTLLDSFMLFPWMLNKKFTPAKSILYFPSDGGGCLPENNKNYSCTKVLNKYDYQVAMSQYGKQQCKEVHGLNVDYIPHAVHTDIYFPLSKEQKEELRRNFVIYNCDGQAIKGGLQNKFVIGSVFRNQGRKMADRMLATMEVISKEYKDTDDIIFLAHCDPEDIAAISDLRHLADRMNIRHKIYFTGMKYFKGFPINEMNAVYNLQNC